MSREYQKEIKDILLVLAGCFVLALADSMFIIPCEIVNGGIDSIGILLNFFLAEKVGFNLIDIILGALQLILWIAGWIILGKKFALHTLLGTLAFPLFYSLLLRTDFNSLIRLNRFYERNTLSGGGYTLSFLLISGIFGGLLSGLGVGLTYLGNGSTGGLDILSFIIAKYTDIRVDISGLASDTILIIIGFLCLQKYDLLFVGILSAFVCALTIKASYIKLTSYKIVNIISDHPEPILDFIHHQLDHGSTLMNIEGGYSGTNRKEIRVVIYASEINALKDFIASVDPNAFVSMTDATDIKGEGFSEFVISERNRRKILSKYGVVLKQKGEKKNQTNA